MSGTSVASISNGIFRTFTVLTWIVFAALQYNDPDPEVWVSTYLSVVLLYAAEWLPSLRTAERRRSLAGVSRALGVGYFVWALLAFREDPRVDFDSEIFRESMGLVLSSIWLLILPLFQGRSQE
ncbi:transmembrane 220 family protein [Leptospira fluminis]|uniref:transmembrane 220 family protein n=1 Tax=Leptospira fluminis TaxID=2484979 RepID=UPI001AEF8EA3|nr:transmembrane 220 family protein [Leptospira fluminis]